LSKWETSTRQPEEKRDAAICGPNGLHEEKRWGNAGKDQQKRGGGIEAQDGKKPISRRVKTRSPKQVRSRRGFKMSSLPKSTKFMPNGMQLPKKRRIEEGDGLGPRVTACRGGKNKQVIEAIWSAATGGEGKAYKKNSTKKTSGDNSRRRTGLATPLQSGSFSMTRKASRREVGRPSLTRSAPVVPGRSSPTARTGPMETAARATPRNGETGNYGKRTP